MREIHVEKGTQTRDEGKGMNDLKAKINFPSDICEWVTPPKLQSWAQEELGNMNGPVQAGRKPALAVLAFAYTRGIYESEEILGLCRSDALVRALAGGAVFSREDLVDVRHQDRGHLITLTARLLTRALCEKSGDSPATLDPMLRRQVHQCAVDRIDTAIIMDPGHGQ